MRSERFVFCEAKKSSHALKWSASWRALPLNIEILRDRTPREASPPREW